MQRGAAALRLRSALEDFIGANTGDTGTRRHGARHGVSDDDQRLIGLAQDLLGGIGGSQDAGVGRDTPGSRARDRAARPTGEDPGARASAVAMFGAANRAGANAAGGGMNEGNR